MSKKKRHVYHYELRLGMAMITVKTEPSYFLRMIMSEYTEENS